MYLGGWAVTAGIVAVPAAASPCSPGGTCIPDVFPAVSSGSLVASLTHTMTSASGALTVTYTAAVYADPANSYCAGCLDFLFQYNNHSSSTDSILRVTATDFTPVLTDLGYTRSGASEPGGLFVNGTVAPISDDRNFTGDTIGWNFQSSNLVAPGATSDVIEVQTNAMNFANGFTFVVDGGVTQGPSFAPPPPVVQTPELQWVAGAAVLGAGLAAVVLTRRRGRVR